MRKYINIIISISLIIIIILTYTSSPLCTTRKNVFSQGIYTVNSTNGDFKPGEYNFKLISKNSICYIYILDKNYIQRYSKRFDSTDTNSPSALFNTGTLLDGDQIIILGNGEFYFDSL